MSRPDDATDRDGHLLAALRHAPDRDALPPPAVSAAILARAREQARRPASPPAWQRWFDALRLTPHRAAAFGSVAVAVLVGVMWSVNDPVPPPPASAVEAVRAPAAPMPSAAVVVAAPAAPLPPPPPAKRASEKRAEPAKAAPLHDAAPVAREVAPAPAPAPAPATAPAAAPAPALAFAPPRVRATAEASSGAEAANAAQARANVVAELRRTAEQAAPVAQSLSALRIDPLARLDARLDAAGETAIWRHDGRSVTHGASTRAWWAGVLDAARGRWTRQAQAPDAPPWLELVLPDARDGTAAATWWLVSGDAPALVLRTDGVVWRAPLPPSLPASWQQTVSAW